MFVSFNRERPSKPSGKGSSNIRTQVAGRFPAAIYGFNEQFSQIREASFRDPTKGQLHPLWDKIIDCGLSWVRMLLGTSVAVSVRDGDGVSLQAKGRKLSRKEQTKILQVIDTICRGSQPIPNKPATIWYDDYQLLLAYSIFRQGKAQYFYFPEVANLTPTDIRIVGTFMNTFEAALTSTVTVEILFDQRRLLNRRTILAQLRPNDLFYQGLRRLHKYIAWRRNALILTPSLINRVPQDNLSVATDWHVVAERLWGVHDTSLRIGKGYSMDYDQSGLNSIVADLVLCNVENMRPADVSPWEQLILKVLSDSRDLPKALPPARSALAIYFRSPERYPGQEEGVLPSESSSFTVVISDPRENHFSAQHAEVTRQMFTDITQIIGRSNTVSQRLINLWKPSNIDSFDDALVSVEHESQPSADDADEVEALDTTMLAREAPNVLSVDALQVVQLRRDSKSRLASGMLSPLAVFSTQHESSISSERHRIELVDSIKPQIKVKPEADLLWDVFENEIERIYKDPNGIPSKRLAKLFSSRGRRKSYKTVIIIPIRSEGEIAGAIIAYRRKTSEFVDIDKLLIRSLAARIGERIELRRQLADRVRHNACLARVANAESPARARFELVRGARELLNADHAFMMAAEESIDVSYDSISGKIIDVAHTWADGQMSIPPIKSKDEGITGWVYTSGEPLAINDVSSFSSYIPLRNGQQQVVPMSSELAVPIKIPSSLADLSKVKGEHAVLGVLDAMWAQKHEITIREVKTLSVLAQHASAILQLTTSLQDAQQTRDKLRYLHEQVKSLQSLQNDSDVLGWLWSICSKLLSCDALYVWSHNQGSDSIELLAKYGKGTGKAKKAATLNYGKSWNGRLIKRYRDSGEKIDYDSYENMAGGEHIPDTKKETYESRLGCCITPFTFLSDIPSDLDVVWSIALYRFRASNFDERDVSLLQIATEYCERAIQNLRSMEAQERTLELAAATKDIALKFVDNISTAPDEVIRHIISRAMKELKAYSVSVLYYHEVGDTYASPVHYASPEQFSRNPAPRPSGISEAVRKNGIMIEIPDLSAPPKELKEPISSSPFLHKHRKIRSLVACPLYEASDTSSLNIIQQIPDRANGDQSPASLSHTEGKFCGVLFINFTEPKTRSAEELLFISAIGKLLTECGGLEASLTRMRTRALRRIENVTAPSLVFGEILKIAQEGINAEMPPEVTSGSSFKLGGNIYMVETGEQWALLSIRANIGERSGAQAGRQYMGEGVVGKVAKDGDPILLNDTNLQQAKDLEYLPYLKGMRSELAVPIKLPSADASPVPDVAPGVIGVLNIECSHPNAFTPRHQELLSRYVSETPVSLILNLAERHGILLWQAKSSRDRFVNEAAAAILHDLTRPIRKVAEKVRYIRTVLGVSSKTHLDIIKMPLDDLEKESEHWIRLRDTGFLHLQPEILEARSPLDAVEQISSWAHWHEPSLKVEKHDIKEFFIEKGQKDLIARVLENLYQNSKKAQEQAGSKSSRVWIEMKLSEPLGHFQYLDVFFNDDGPGFKNLEETRTNIFRHFRQQRNQPSGDGGWGMGLPCARQIMDAMGGEIELLDSIPNIKTTFRLRFIHSTLGPHTVPYGVKES